MEQAVATDGNDSVKFKVLAISLARLMRSVSAAFLCAQRIDGTVDLQTSQCKNERTRPDFAKRIAKNEQS